MSYWNHRIIDLTEDEDEPFLAIKEVYYEDNGTLRGYCAADVSAESLDELEDCLERMLQAVRTAKELGTGAVLKHSSFPAAVSRFTDWKFGPDGNIKET